MKYEFFAAASDKLELLDFIFKNTDLHIYDGNSQLGQEICEYTTVKEISSKFDLEHKNFLNFQLVGKFILWSPRFKVKPIFFKHELDPKHCEGHTFRNAIGGWGLIQLDFGAIRPHNNCLEISRIAHDTGKSELSKRAYSSQGTWDWKEIHATSSKLKKHIENKMVIKKIGGYPALLGALELKKKGIKVR
jgi:hypothetical protein